MKRASSLKQEQDREYEAMVLKTTRLRELRLAKEAADREAATPLWPSLVADEPDEASKASAAPGNALGRACVSSASPGTPPKGRPDSQEGHSRTAKATLTNHHAFLKSVNAS